MPSLPAGKRSFAALVQRELDPRLNSDTAADATVEGGQDQDWLRDPPRDLFGISISGGGIRSSTFNLGLLQGLDSFGLLRGLDYVSTVSGGGYVGGFWTAWRKRNNNVAAFPAIDPLSSASNGQRQPSEPPEIRRLREYSNFLNPRLALFSFDTGRIVSALFASVIPTMAAACSFIALLTFAWLALAWTLMTPLVPAVSAGAMALLTAVILAGTEISWRLKEKSKELTYVIVGVAATLITTVVWLGLYVLTASATPQNALLLWADAGARRLLLGPPAAWFAAAISLVFVRFISAAIWKRNLSSGIDRVLSRFLFASLVWLGVGGLWIAAQTLLGTRGLIADIIGGAGTGALGVVITKLHGFFARQPNKPAGSRIAALLKPRLPQVLSYLFVALLATLVMAVIGQGSSLFGPLPVLFVAAGITALVLLFFEPNEVGLHSFYRNRLARAFLGAAAANDDNSPRYTEPQPDDDIALNACPREAPLHLVCCAANDLTSEEQFHHLHRGADSAVLSPVGFSVGSQWSPWPESGAAGVATLADAMTASAAAFNSQMGSWSVKLGPAAVFTLASLNLRLGLWWPHPGSQSRLRWLRGLPFYKEMLGQTSAGGTDVHLSDGGHFENMALYELIRRHCRYIIVSDCGADPDVAFDDLGNVVRRVREDFNVEISIDLSPLRLENGRARQPMVAGDIQYPDGDTGVLLLFKPTLIGDEPPDVSQYSKRNVTFPHESTGDQFYDEAQWESYRRLGLHAALSAFRFVGAADTGSTEETSAKARERCARIFAQARFEWTPPPQGFAANVESITQCQAGLDRLLAQSGGDKLRVQVFREVADAKDAGRAEVKLVDSLDSVPLLRDAIRQMEQIFHLAQLGQHAAHPINLGNMNVLGRWAGAPLFRDWWPLLRSLSSSPFANFLERTFGLETHFETAIFPANSAADRERGFALNSLRDSQGGRLPLDEKEVIGLHRVQTRNGVMIPEVQLAVVVCELINPELRILSWNANRFFVPPGLWGMGLGNRFLTLLAEYDFNMWVRIPKPVGAQWTARKTAADLAQLYRGAGFANDPSEGMGSKEVPGPAALLATQEPGTYRWMVRNATGSKPMTLARTAAMPALRPVSQ